MVQILMSPRSGWEDVLADSQSPRQVLIYGLIPLSLIAALTVFVGYFYQSAPNVSEMLIKAVVVFARYVLTYFIAVALLVFALPRLTSDGIIERRRIELLTAYCIGMMALIGILENVLPMEMPLLQFLPIYIVVIIIQSRRFVDVDEANSFRYAACAIAGIILPVFIIDRILLP